MNLIASLLFVSIMITLDLYPSGFQKFHSYSGLKEDRRHIDHIVDQFNLYEQGSLSIHQPRFKDPKIKAKYGKNGLNWRYFRQENHNFYVHQEHPEYLSFKKQEDLIVFVINGNQGSHEQFPIIINCLENYTNYLTENQNHLT